MIRKRIVDHNKSRDGDNWDLAGRVLDTLDLQGMSGEESDDESSTRNNKKLRNLRLPWIADELRAFKRVIDSYEGAFENQHIVITRRGNRGLDHSTSSREDQQSVAVAGLPRNWYNSAWYSRLKPWEKARLDAKQDFALPRLV